MNKDVHFWARVAVVPRINVFALAAKNVDGRTFCGEDVRGMLIYLPAFSKVLFFYQVGCEYLYHNNN